MITYDHKTVSILTKIKILPIWVISTAYPVCPPAPHQINLKVRGGWGWLDQVGIILTQLSCNSIKARIIWLTKVCE